MALASMVLGITGLVAWFLPALGTPVTITGLILGIIALRRPNQSRGMAVTGIITSSLGLAASIINGVLGVLLPGDSLRGKGISSSWPQNC